MKSPFFLFSCLAVAILCFGAISCEQHPLEDAKKLQEEQQAAEKQKSDSSSQHH